MLKAEQINDGLSNFYGTENYHLLSPLAKLVGLVTTDGVAWLAKNAGCFWLIDEIAAKQPDFKKDKYLRDIQFWTLKVTGTAASLICERDEGKVAYTKEIPYTDFPLPEIRIWVEAGECGDKPVMVAMLPSER